jgi:hypothetical protein
VAERLNAPALKAGMPVMGIAGSNPALSAIKLFGIKYPITSLASQDGFRFTFAP